MAVAERILTNVAVEATDTTLPQGKPALTQQEINIAWRQGVSFKLIGPGEEPTDEVIAGLAEHGRGAQPFLEEKGKQQAFVEATLINFGVRSEDAAAVARETLYDTPVTVFSFYPHYGVVYQEGAREEGARETIFATLIDPEIIQARNEAKAERAASLPYHPGTNPIDERRPVIDFDIKLIQTEARFTQTIKK